MFDFDEAYNNQTTNATNPRFRVVPSFASTANAELMAWELFSVLGGSRATSEGVWDSSAVQRARDALATVPQFSSLLDDTLNSLTFFQLRDFLARQSARQHQGGAEALIRVEAYLQDVHRQYQARNLLPKTCALLLPFLLDDDDHDDSESRLTNPTVTASAVAAPQLVVDRSRLLSAAHESVEHVGEHADETSKPTGNDSCTDEDELLLREASRFRDDPVVAHLASLMETYRKALASP